MSTRKRNRRNRRKRRTRRGGQNYGSATAKQSMTKKGRSTMGRFGSTRSGKRFGVGISRKRSKLKKPPPKGKAPRPGNRSGPDPMVWRTNPLFKGKTRKQFIKEHKKMTKKMKGNDTLGIGNAARVAAERKLEKYYGSNRVTTGKDVKVANNADMRAAPGAAAFRSAAWDRRKRRDMTQKMRPHQPRPAFCNSLNKKTQMYKKKCMGPGKAAAKQAALIVGKAVHQAAKQAAAAAPAIIKKAVEQDPVGTPAAVAQCPVHCRPIAAAGGSRRRRRRRRSRRGGGMTGVFARRRSRRRR